MGCDYIIQIGLKITYKDGKYEFIETDRLNKYFDEDVCFDFNSDLSDEEQDAFFKEKFLTVTYKPLILYENDSWIKEKYKDKYSDQNILLENVDKIEKIQKKYFR
jgi:hypothetical protein